MAAGLVGGALGSPNASMPSERAASASSGSSLRTDSVILDIMDYGGRVRKQNVL
jgi:hypothetical protein